MIKKISMLFVCMLFIGYAHCDTVTPKNSNSIEKVDDSAIVTKKLKNGMKVILKQTTFDTGQVYIRMVAPGGYSSLPQESIASAIISIHAALESGFEEVSADHFYTEDIELSIELLPFYRRIQGFSEVQEFPKLLEYVSKYFKIKKFKSEAFNIAKAGELKKVSAAKLDFDRSFQNMFLNLNTQNFKPMQHPDIKEVKKADMQLSEEIFKRLFANASEFVIVVVGDFNQEKMIQELEQHLGSLPTTETPSDFNKYPPPSFPKQIITQVVPARQEQRTSLARLTFPITTMNTDIYATLSLLEEFLQDYITDNIKSRFPEDIGLEVFFENPIYPREGLSLFVIQYRSETAQVKKIQKAILHEVARLCAQGISQEQMEATNKKIKEEDPFWLRDNTYWLTLLTDYTVVQWPITDETGTPEELSKVKLEQLNLKLREMFCKNRYTFLYSYPN